MSWIAYVRHILFVHAEREVSVSIEATFWQIFSQQTPESLEKYFRQELKRSVWFLSIDHDDF